MMRQEKLCGSLCSQIGSIVPSEATESPGSEAKLVVFAESPAGVQKQFLEPLRHMKGVAVHEVTDGFDSVVERAKRLKPIPAALQPHFRATTADVAKCVAGLKQICKRVSLLDSTDPTALRWPGVLDAVDLYVKKQVLRDRAEYTRRSATGFWFADWCVQERGWDIGEWFFSTTSAPSSSLAKLRCGWTLGAAHTHRHFARLCQILRPFRLAAAWPRRKVDVHCVVKTMGRGDVSFYTRHRNEAVEKLMKLNASHNTLLAAFGGGGEPAPMSSFQYRRSLLKSKIIVSPFGWGEICHRDYEAFAAGSLLVKPDMKFVETNPDLFKPFETYIPVKWDLSDLESTCREWLGRPQEAMAIAERGQALFREYVFGDSVQRQANSICSEILGN